jgi:hypothetical protein
MKLRLILAALVLAALALAVLGLVLDAARRARALAPSPKQGLVT